MASEEQRYLVLETKGYDPLEEVKTQAAHRWVRAVNASEGYGVWDYAVVGDLAKVETALEEAVDRKNIGRQP